MQVLDVVYSDGRAESLLVHCGRAKYARCLPVRVGRALLLGLATASLRYDGLPRTAVRVGLRYYMRVKRD
jgi:hypothetical protein